MTDPYTRIRLGPEAVEYVKNSLASGKTLAKFLLGRRELGGGEVVTFLPPGANLEGVNNFSRGGVLPAPPRETHRHYTAADGTEAVMVPVPSPRARLAETIQEFLEQGEGRLCLFESALADGYYISYYTASPLNYP